MLNSLQNQIGYRMLGLSPPILLLFTIQYPRSVLDALAETRAKTERVVRSIRNGQAVS